MIFFPAPDGRLNRYRFGRRRWTSGRNWSTTW